MANLLMAIGNGKMGAGGNTVIELVIQDMDKNEIARHTVEALNGSRFLLDPNRALKKGGNKMRVLYENKLKMRTSQGTQMRTSGLGNLLVPSLSIPFVGIDKTAEIVVTFDAGGSYNLHRFRRAQPRDVPIPFV